MCCVGIYNNSTSNVYPSTSICRNFDRRPSLPLIPSITTYPDVARYEHCRYWGIRHCIQPHRRYRRQVKTDHEGRRGGMFRATCCARRGFSQRQFRTTWKSDLTAFTTIINMHTYSSELDNILRVLTPSFRSNYPFLPPPPPSYRRLTLYLSTV